MKVTNDGKLIVEITNTVHGCLEQGGVCGRKVAFDVSEVSDTCVVSIDDLQMMEDVEDYIPGRTTTLWEAIRHHGLEGEVIDPGVVIL